LSRWGCNISATRLRLDRQSCTAMAGMLALAEPMMSGLGNRWSA
jgi:hypothetical protein